MNVYLLTPTGGRPLAFGLLAECVRSQTYEGPVTWLITDDVQPVTALECLGSVRAGHKVHIDYPRPLWKPGTNTQARNMNRLLELLPKTLTEHDIVLVLEDDDYYAPEYVSTMVQRLTEGTARMVGDRHAVYYNVCSRMYRRMSNTNHASLCNTGFRGVLAIETLRRMCNSKRTFIDIELWRHFRGAKKLFDDALCVGIKGLPGRPGIGVGHKRDFAGTPDANGQYLRQLAPRLADRYLRGGRDDGD